MNWVPNRSEDFGFSWGFGGFSSVSSTKAETFKYGRCFTFPTCHRKPPSSFMSPCDKAQICMARVGRSRCLFNQIPIRIMIEDNSIPGHHSLARNVFHTASPTNKLKPCPGEVFPSNTRSPSQVFGNIPASKPHRQTASSMKPKMSSPWPKA